MKPKKIFIILSAVLSFYGCTSIKRKFIKEKYEFIEHNKELKKEVFTEELIRDLPEPIKKYLRICGYMDTPIPINANVYWSESWLRMAPEKNWTQLNTTQFNSVKPIGRISHMKFLSMPIAARDLYINGYGEMNGKLFNFINVVFSNDKQTTQSALITIFCEFMLVPGYLLLENVKWEEIDEYSVRGTLIDNDIEVSGIFYFNEDGLFTHFETYDRYYLTGKNTYKKVKFSAVVESYKIQNDIKISEKVNIIWHLSQGDYKYYKGIVDRIEFNVFDN